jgi:hypothetical protein
MDNFKPFDPNDIDESLTRVVAHGGHRYLLFPHINATGTIPKFNSISYVIGRAAPAIADFLALSRIGETGGKKCQVAHIVQHSVAYSAERDRGHRTACLGG